MSRGPRNKGLLSVIIFVCVPISPFFHGTDLKFTRGSFLCR